MLEVLSLSCRRGGRPIFKSVAFTVEAGGFLLLTGPNGSGKSSLLRLLAGLLAPAQGRILWQEKDVKTDRAGHRNRLHYIGHLDAVKPALTVFETLSFWAALYGVSADAACMDAFALCPLADRQARHLSTGQKKRLSLSRLALRTAPLWLLDEPLTALDKAGQDLLHAHIARHRAGGGIVIAASHDTVNAPGLQFLNVRDAAS